MRIATRATLLVMVAFAGGAAADEDIFRNMDVFELEVAADPQISPDGR